MELQISSLLLLLLIVFQLNSVTYAKNNEKTTRGVNPISYTCQKTKNPPLCSKVLNANKKAREADSLRALGPVTLNVAIAKTKAAIKSYVALHSSAKSKIRRTQVMTCRENYENALKHLETAKTRFHDNIELSYKNVAEAAGTPGKCEDTMKRATMDVKRINEMCDAMYSACVVIVTQLAGKINLSF